MKNSRQSKKRFKWVISIVLVCSILLGSGAGYFALSYQVQPVINDYTQTVKQDQNPGSDEHTEGSGDDAAAVLSSSVKMFTGDSASQINAAIDNVQATNAGLYFDVEDGTAFEDLGIGDIFYLEGSESSPLGETYIGRITNISDQSGGATYLIEAPMVDEVFDVLRFDYEQVLTTENITDIETLDGVNVTKTDSLSSYFTNVSSTFDNEAEVLPLKSDASVVPLADASGTEGLLFDYNIDLLEAFGLDKNSSPDFQEKYDVTESERIQDVKVYRTTTGICYHRETCPCVGRSKFEMTLTEAADEGFEPCLLCNPPLLTDGGVSNFDAQLELEGKVGLESIDFGLDYDWDILNGEGLENLSISADGNFLAEAKLNANFEYELSGRTTTLSLPFNTLKLQGLKEKMFPIAFIGFNGSVTPVVSGNESIRMLTGAVPMTIGVIVYVDLSGNVSIGASAYFSYSQSFQYHNDVVKNGEWTFEQTVETEPSFKAGLEAEVSGDADVHLGCSLSLYVFNLNVVELAAAKVGAEAEGTVKLEYSTDTQNKSENEISGSYYMRLYYKLLELNVKLKTKVKIWSLVNLSSTIDYSYIYLDKTIAEWGLKSPTRFQSGIMSYTAMTAQDANAIYYKDTDGKLIREAEGYRTVLFDRDFFSICGIDESYLYLLIPNENGVYDIYRVALDGSGANKKIAEDISNCLTIDETYIYYVTDFDTTTICRLNREYLKEDTFATFSDDVKYMAAQDADFYVVTEEGGTLASLFGGTSRCYLLNRSGDIIGDYGTNPEIKNYYLSDNGSYYQAARMVSSGYLRSTASEIHWMSKGKDTTVLAEGISGWNAKKDIGIFTTLNNNGTGKAPYKIVLYRAADGSRKDVTEVNSNQAFFTLCQSSGGEWYFFDQTDTELTLYVMDANFNSKKAIKTFSLSEIPYDLSDCSMTIMNKRIYFYTMPDSKTSKVLYRYDLV